MAGHRCGWEGVVVMKAVFVLMCLLGGSGCASSGGVRCKPDDSKLAMCGIDTHEECEHRDDGCMRCTCVPNRIQNEGHGPFGPE